jgi:hypothetical protein
MPTRKMTFTLPEEVVAQFTRAVAPSRRSRYVAEALQARLRDRDALFEAACDVLDGDADLEQLDREMDLLNNDPVEGAMHAPEAR